MNTKTPLQIDKLTSSSSTLFINETNVIKIQKWFRGCLVRLKRLPMIMYAMQKYLQSQTFAFSSQTNDGRINSCVDEDKIIELLNNKFNNRIEKPNIRMWYDILVFDYMYGWIPVNIKTTTTLSCDNTGNMAMCVHAYTNKNLNLHKKYNSGEMSTILYKKLKNKKYNKNNKKDYYFLVLNKTNHHDVIINSVKGLTTITPNSNNLPFQICWNKNRTFTYGSINTKIKLLIDSLQKPKQNWKEIFLTNIRTLHL